MTMQLLETRIYIVCSAFVGASIPRIQIDHFAFKPAAVRLTQFQRWDANKPIGWRRYHRNKWHQVIFRVNTKHGKSFSRDIWIWQSTRFDYRPNAIALFVGQQMLFENKLRIFTGFNATDFIELTLLLSSASSVRVIPSSATSFSPSLAKSPFAQKLTIKQFQRW